MNKLDPNNYDPKVIEMLRDPKIAKMMRSHYATENAKKSIKAQKKKHGKGYKDEMSRRGKLGGRPKKALKNKEKLCTV